jgi:hypothetical protein
MPLCEFGSERREDAPAYIVLDASYAAQMLPPPVQWLIPYIPFLSPISLSLDTFCSLDPSTVEIPTAAELLALVTRNPYATAFAAGQKVASILHYFAWYTFCRCSDSTPLPAPTYPSAPADLPVVNPPQYSPPGELACRVDVASTSCERTGTTVGEFRAWPTGATSFRITAQIENPTYPVLVGVYYYTDAADGTANVFTSRAVKAPYNGAITWDGTPTLVTANSALYSNVSGGGYRVWMTSNGNVAGYADATSTAQLSIEIYCGNDPTTPPDSFNPCIPCPPDPYLSGQLAIILGELAIMKQQIDLIQRQAVPFATIDGTLHSSLTGAGELSVQGLIGARIAIVDSLAGTVGVTAGEPETLHGTGWIRWGDDVGWLDREFLTSEVTLSTPAAAGAMTRLGYSLPPGVEIDIIELEREP